VEKKTPNCLLRGITHIFTPAEDQKTSLSETQLFDSFNKKLIEGFVELMRNLQSMQFHVAGEMLQLHVVLFCGYEFFGAAALCLAKEFVDEPLVIGHMVLQGMESA
jgi:hypothetical protein